MTQDPRKPLDGITVLSFEIQVAGPYCTMMLADQGADVIKVERPGSGDSARGGAPMVEGADGQVTSGYFLRFNRNKRSITLDLKDDQGQRLFRELAATSDVVIDNFRPGLLEGLGLGYAALSEDNPGLVMASISGFGSMEEFTGPFSARPAYDIVAQAMGGLMNTCGQADGPPTWLGVALGDIVSGMNAAQAITLALYERTRTGRGQFIDVSMYDTIIALAERSISAYSLAGDVLERGREPYMAPWGPFECEDGWVALIVATERDWARFCDAIERPELVGADGATSGPERARAMTGWLGEVVAAWFAQRSKEQATARLLDAGLAVGPVQSAPEILDCPHVAAREIMIDVPDPVLGSVRLVGPPVKMSGSTTAVRNPAPRLGEHTDQVLAQRLGRSDEQVAQLRAAGAI